MFEAKIVANPGPQVHYFMRTSTENIFIHLEYQFSSFSLVQNFNMFEKKTVKFYISAGIRSSTPRQKLE